MNMQSNWESSKDALEPSSLYKCMQEIRGEFMMGISNGGDEGCRADGTLGRARFFDTAGHITLLEEEGAGGTSTYTLKKQNLSFTIDKSSRMLSYSNGDHLYSFDPAKQAPLVSARENAFVPLRLVDTVDNKSVQLDGGLSATTSDGTTVFQLPDGGPRVTINKYGSVNEIAKANKYEYKFDPQHLSKLDPNVPKDARLYDAYSIRRDAEDALTSSGVQGFPGQLDAKDRVSQHITEMPRDKQVEYVTKIQKEVEELDKNRDAIEREHLRFSKDKDGGVKSVTIDDGLFFSFIPDPWESIGLYGAY